MQGRSLPMGPAGITKSSSLGHGMSSVPLWTSGLLRRVMARSMKRTLAAGAIVTLISSTAIAGKPVVTGPFAFTPQSVSAAPGSQDPCQPLALPDGFRQTILVAETDACGSGHLVLDAVADDSDWRDMNTVNETGRQVGRFLYTTHENDGGAGALSVIDLSAHEATVYVAGDFGISPPWSRLDGIEWTPWGTVLVAEENGASGRVFECHVDGLNVVDCIDRPRLGRMSHEGIAADENGNVFVGDELNGGSIYRFVPDRYGDLSSGTLYALNIPGSTTVCSGATGEGVTPLGQAEWVALEVADGQTAREAADLAGVSGFCRPEDAEIIGGNLYVVTTGTKNVLRIPLDTATPYVTEYAGINTNMRNESDVPSYGLNGPDNLASDTAGNLYIVEDNSGRSDIWVATPDRDGDGTADAVVLFGTLTTVGGEGTGIYFPRTLPQTMLINVQHAADGNDMTLTITRD